MARMIASRVIDAPPEKVFDTVAHIDSFRQAVPHIINVEFLTDTRQGVGTKFRETRLMRGREATTELEVTEYAPNETVRIVADAGGTIWDTRFTVKATEVGTELVMVGDARPHKLMAKVVTPLIAPLLRRALEADLDAVKAYCEQS